MNAADIGFTLYVTTFLTLAFFVFGGPQRLGRLRDYWDERHYRRLLRQRAIEYMRLGVAPHAARATAASELAAEAEGLLP